MVLPNMMVVLSLTFLHSLFPFFPHAYTHVKCTYNINGWKKQRPAKKTTLGSQVGNSKQTLRSCDTSKKWKTIVPGKDKAADSDFRWARNSDKQVLVNSAVLLTSSLNSWKLRCQCSTGEAPMSHPSLPHFQNSSFRNCQSRNGLIAVQYNHCFPGRKHFHPTHVRSLFETIDASLRVERFLISLSDPICTSPIRLPSTLALPLPFSFLHSGSFGVLIHIHQGLTMCYTIIYNLCIGVTHTSQVTTYQWHPSAMTCQ